MTDTLDIFNDALERPSDERSAFVYDACGDDEAKRARILHLLAQHERAETLCFLPVPAADPDEGPPADERIGPYRIEREIGAGGMGRVYLATQTEPMRRRVALKVIKPGMDSEAVVRRFEAERQALALLEHPSIASVYDGGTTSEGRPYFSMEYVEGLPITEYCDHHRVDVFGRLALLSKTCDAIQHAHQKGIIHRDLKPSNIIVTGGGDAALPKVIDFGIARALHEPLMESAALTMHGEVMGTPEYMSPEQARSGAADVDTRADVYALGVMMYELLAGVLPFDPARLRADGTDAMLRMIREVEPLPPSARFRELPTDQREDIAARRRLPDAELARAIRGELDWITKKAMHKDRARRYATTAELADDLQRVRGRRPVIAGPDSRMYRVRKFLRRRRREVALAMVVVAASVAGVFGLVRGTIAEAELQKRDDQQDWVGFINDRLVNTLARGVDGRDVDEVGDQLRDHVGAFEDDRWRRAPLLRANAYQAYAEALANLDDSASAERLYVDALRLRRQELGETHASTQETMRDLAVLYAKSGRWDEALALARQRVDTCERELGSDDPRTKRARRDLEWLTSRRDDSKDRSE